MSPDLVEQGQRIAQALTDAGAAARLFGGVAIALQCPSARAAPLRREYGDLDLVTTRRSAGALGGVLADFGYRPAERFNSLHGRARLLFESDETHVDVFVNRFEMCHVLELEQRLELGPLTLTLADLLLTKLQVAQINRKDVTDAVALLLDHELSAGDAGIDIGRCTAVLAADWGWWRTATENLAKLTSLAPGLGLDAAQLARLSAQVEQLSGAIAAAPKGIKWRGRARLGDRVPWRNDPEEIAL